MTIQYRSYTKLEYRRARYVPQNGWFTNRRSMRLLEVGRALGLGFVFILGNVKAAYGNEGWLADEDLRQLQEIRTEVKALRSEVAELHQQLDAKQATGGTSEGSSHLEVSLEGEPVIGNSDAKLAIVEFSDFQCPFCTRQNGKVLVCAGPANLIEAELSQS